MGENNRNLTGVLAINAGTDILPTADNFADLGSAAQRFRNIFGVTVTANTLNSGTANTFSHLPRTDNAYDLGSSGLKWKDLYLAGTLTAPALTTTNLEVVTIKARNNVGTLYNMLRQYLDATFGNVTELRNSAGINYIQCTENTDNRISGNVRLFGALSMQGTNGIFFPSYQVAPVSTTGLTLGAYTGTNQIVFSNNSGGNITITAAGNLNINGLTVIGGGLLPANDLSWDMGSGGQRWGNFYCAGITATGDCIPNANNTYSSGNSSKRWSNVYTVNSNVSTNLNIGTTAGWHFNEIGGTDLYCSNTGGVGVKITSGATSWSAISDRRSKRKISYLRDSGTLAKLLQLKTCYFNYHQDDNTVPPRIGLIAQDAEQQFPDVVDTQKVSKEKDNDDTMIDDVEDDVGLKSIRYTDLIPYLIKSIQELSAKVDVLTADLESVKKKVK